MKASIRTKLDIIEDMLMSEDGRDIAMVLSALRGPDRFDDGSKERTTAFVRSAAFPRLRELAHIVEDADSKTATSMWLFNKVGQYPDPTCKRDSVMNHFKGHIALALEVLGVPLESSDS